MMMERSGAGSVLVTNGSGCGSGRPKNIQILRIRDPQHCYTLSEPSAMLDQAPDGGVGGEVEVLLDVSLYDEVTDHQLNILFG